MTKKQLQYGKGKKDVRLVGRSSSSATILLTILSHSLQLSLPACAPLRRNPESQGVSEGQRAYLGQPGWAWHARDVRLPNSGALHSLQRSDPNPGILPQILQALPSFGPLVLKMQFLSKRNKSVDQQNECTHWGKGCVSLCVLTA